MGTIEGELMAGQEVYRVYQYTVAASESLTLDIAGRYLAVIEATAGSDIAVGLDGGNPQFIEQGLTVSTRDGEEFKRVELLNNGGAPAVVKIAVGTGDFRDARFTFAGGSLNTTAVPPATLQTGGDVTIGAAASDVQIMAANASACERLVSVPPWAIGPIRVYDGNGGGVGVFVHPGETLAIKTSDRVRGSNDWGEAVIVQRSETLQ